MKRFKSIAIYSILIALCVLAFAGNFFTKRLNRENNNAGVENTPQNLVAEVPEGKALQDNTNIAVNEPRVQKLTLEEKMAKSTETPKPDPVVGIAQGDDHFAVTREAIANAGGLKGIVKAGDTVILKPNLIIDAEADDGITTDYRVVQEVANIVKGLGATKIIVAEGSPMGNIFTERGYDKITGVELMDLNQFGTDDCYKLKPQNSVTGKAFYIPKPYMDADVVITIAKLKTHVDRDAVVTLSLKNSFGVPPTKLYFGAGMKGQLHNLGVKNAIVDLNKIRKPDFAVIDGIVGGEGLGPGNCDPVKSRVIIAGEDPVAVDTISLNFMGFTVNEVPHVKLAAQKGLGISDLNAIKVAGADLNAIKMKFKKPF